MKTICIAIIFLFLTACIPDHLGNEEIIKQTKLCQQSGMGVHVLVHAWTSQIVVVECFPKVDKP
jgi:hypothetical protein